MKVYYLDAEYEAGKHRILAANYERDDFSWRNTINDAYSVLAISEVDPENKGVCADLSRTVNKTDEDDESRFFIDADGDLAENVGWVEHVEIPDI